MTDRSATSINHDIREEAHRLRELAHAGEVHPTEMRKVGVRILALIDDLPNQPAPPAVPLFSEEQIEAIYGPAPPRWAPPPDYDPGKQCATWLTCTVNGIEVHPSTIHPGYQGTIVPSVLDPGCAADVGCARGENAAATASPPAKPRKWWDFLLRSDRPSCAS